METVIACNEYVTPMFCLCGEKLERGTLDFGGHLARCTVAELRELEAYYGNLARRCTEELGRRSGGT